jgi:hypothetical protein
LPFFFTIPLAVSRGQCIVSSVTVAPSSADISIACCALITSFFLPADFVCANTNPWVLVHALSAHNAPCFSPSRERRNVLPSIARHSAPYAARNSFTQSMKHDIITSGASVPITRAIKL